MRKYFAASVVLIPFLLALPPAALAGPDDSYGSQHVVFGSEDNEGGSSYLGVDITDVTGERVSALKLKDEKGVEITMVDQDAPAGKAGIKEHDVILTMNGSEIESAAQLRRMIHETPSGRVVTFGLSRDGQPLTIKVQLGDRHKEFPAFAPDNFRINIPEVHVMPDIDIPSINMVVVTSSARSGLTMENITPQLGEYFGVKNGHGVLVRSVEKGSRAEKAGFHAGDVIVKCNDQPIHDTSDFTHALKERKGNSATVGVMRDRKEQNLNLSFPDKKDSSELLEEESFENQVQAESNLEAANLRDQLAKLSPTLESAMENARKSAADAQKAWSGQQRKFVEQAQEQVRKQQREWKKDQEKLKLELDRMVREMRRNRLDL